MRVGIIGAGISGVSLGRILQDTGHEVVLFEAKSTPGGLVRCTREEGNLFHRVGGHVFNAKNPEVFDWFWRHFDREQEFMQTRRKAKIWLNGQYVGYPIENYIYQLPPDTVQSILDDILTLNQQPYRDPFSYPHFEAFLRGNFGSILYELYFKPYNEKIWRADLTKVSLKWLEGKLPMPNYREMLLSNILRQEEDKMVHSTFYYPREGGSQFIINRLAEGLDIRTNTPVQKLQREANQWIVNENHRVDRIVYTGDIRRLATLLDDSFTHCRSELEKLKTLPSNGTSNILCYTDETDLSWLYVPNPDIKAHRIIYTGNFSVQNNAPGKRKTCTVEFSGHIDQTIMITELKKLPGNLKPIAFNYEPNSYVIQEEKTRTQVATVSDYLAQHQCYLLGRFAEWEYYNMDKAIEAGMKLFTQVSC